ncbi:MAG: 3'-5' exonuclease [Gammaproteobacteria bacterium]|nr:3'-5' exonuclease [Gammaproteobacteria bacterium]
MNILTFDIETIPDVETARRIYGLDGLTDADTARAMYQQRRQETGGNEFLPLHMHRIIAISIALRRNGDFRLWTLGTPKSGEAELITRFYEGIEKYTPELVSWNGGGFDLPVLHYRALLHGISAPRFWETGDTDTSFRYNNYLSRYHWRHLDLMDVLSGFQLRGAAPLDEISQMLGLPGKLGMHGGEVLDAYLNGGIEQIRNYCETDVLNTYLVYLRFELMRGRLDLELYRNECLRVRKSIEQANKPHLHEFLSAWSTAFDQVRSI